MWAIDSSCCASEYSDLLPYILACLGWLAASSLPLTRLHAGYSNVHNTYAHLFCSCQAVLLQGECFCVGLQAAMQQRPSRVCMCSTPFFTPMDFKVSFLQALNC